MDVDTRLLRSFSAVAEEGNLTRAAERLYVSQPALTKQVRRLEQLLGVRLFTRSHAGMALTGPGRVLAERVPGLLTAWDDAFRATRGTAARETRVLRVGCVASGANEATQDIVAAFAGLRPGWRVDLRQASWADPSAGLADGAVDAALLRLPFPGQAELCVEPLLTEPRWVALPSAHPLAARETVDVRDLWDEPFVAAPAETGAWRDFWLAVGERGDRPVRIGAVAEHPDDWLNAVASGYGIAFAPESAARFYSRPGVVYRPTRGLSPSRVAVAWAGEDEADPVIRDFVRCCLERTCPAPVADSGRRARTTRPEVEP